MTKRNTGLLKENSKLTPESQLCLEFEFERDLNSLEFNIKNNILGIGIMFSWFKKSTNNM